LPVTVIQEATEHLLAKPLLLGLGDKSEACRELAINTLISLLQACECPATCCCIPFHVTRLAQPVYIGSNPSCNAGCSRCSNSCSSICCTSAGRKATSSGGEWKLMHTHLLVCAACIKYNPTIQTYLVMIKVTQGEQTEELRLSLLHLVTEIIASARKVGTPSARTCQLASANNEYVCHYSLFACMLFTHANSNIAHQTAVCCLCITVPSAAVGSHMM